MEATKIKVAKLKKARIEIIPLIDVIFFLLATFVLFTLSLNRILSLPVNLPVPNPNTQTLKEEDETVILQVSAEESLFWNREPMEFGELPGRLTAYKSNVENAGKQPRIMVSNDEKAKFGQAVRVLDEIRKSGIKSFSVETTNTRATGK
ncbi:MAG TPA: biopolymer transporter ExbD [Opitutaceae bacterium]|nr:biopolymer transporter ExbD [Opitutaceae bacterium]